MTSAHGAAVAGPPATFPFGERQYSAHDLAGHRWTFSQSVADVDPADWGGQLAAATAEPPASANLRALDTLVDAFNNHDLDRIMDFFADDCSLDMPRGTEPWGRRYVGKAAVREGLQGRFDMVPDVHYGDARHFATDEMGVSEWLLTGTLQSGATLAVRGCDHYEFRDGKIVRKDSYWKIVG
ncbi:MAG: nuclear transport factor 2 family protein [Acidobacteria bacterium]|nr:nuclear transport factor 2 family protein [Acidobacteriota bacterium]